MPFLYCNKSSITPFHEHLRHPFSPPWPVAIHLSAVHPLELTSNHTGQGLLKRKLLGARSSQTATINSCWFCGSSIQARLSGDRILLINKGHLPKNAISKNTVYGKKAYVFFSSFFNRLTLLLLHHLCNYMQFQRIHCTYFVVVFLFFSIFQWVICWLVSVTQNERETGTSMNAGFFFFFISPDQWSELQVLPNLEKAYVLKGYFPKENFQKGHKHMKRCLASLDMSEAKNSDPIRTCMILASTQAKIKRTEKSPWICGVTETVI